MSARTSGGTISHLALLFLAPKPTNRWRARAPFGPKSVNSYGNWVSAADIVISYFPSQWSTLERTPSPHRQVTVSPTLKVSSPDVPFCWDSRSALFRRESACFHGLSGFLLLLPSLSRLQIAVSKCHLKEHFPDEVLLSESGSTNRDSRSFSNRS